MRHVRQATSDTRFPAEGHSRRGRLSFVQRAPGPEAPDLRDKDGAQIGMLILLVAGAVFWIGVAVLALHYLR